MEKQPGEIIARFLVDMITEYPELDAIGIHMKGLEKHEEINLVCVNGSCKFAQLGKFVDVRFIPVDGEGGKPNV